MRGNAVLGRRIGILTGRLDVYGDFSIMKNILKKKMKKNERGGQAIIKSLLNPQGHTPTEAVIKQSVSERENKSILGRMHKSKEWNWQKKCLDGQREAGSVGTCDTVRVG